MSTYLHPTAICEDDVTLGEGTRVWHHAHIRTGARIGADCNLGKNVFVDEGVQIGSGVKIQNNVSVFRGVRIEDEVFVGPSAVFTNDRVPRASGSEWALVPTVVRRGASIGANATIVCGCDVGEHAMVAAGAVVTRPVEANEVVAGNPARRLGWVCPCGRQLVRETGPRPELACESCAGVTPQ